MLAVILVVTARASRQTVPRRALASSTESIGRTRVTHKVLRTICYLALVAALAVGCRRSASSDAPRPLTISAIPDQDPEKLQRLYSGLAEYLNRTTGISVKYIPVTDYKAVVTAFKVGELDLVWFGGLTGVQARLQVPGAEAILQRDIDEKFTSVFIANTASGIKSLQDLKGQTFTFGSESSTSGRLMPQYFLEQDGIRIDSFRGRPGFSGSHDKTIELVTAGSFSAGVLNEQVWRTRLANHDIDTARVAVIATTPAYHDYHWVLHPRTAERLGSDVKAKLVQAFTALSPENPEHARILELFGAKQFIETNNDNYKQIEDVGRSIGLITAARP
jgi:phosphonate transport system substrate-binding protein